MEALEALVDLGGVGEEEEEGQKELDEGGCDEGGRRGRHETHKGDKGQDHFSNEKLPFPWSDEIFAWEKGEKSSLARWSRVGRLNVPHGEGEM